MTLFDWLLGRSSEPQRRDQQRTDGFEPFSSRTDRASGRPFFGHAEQVPEGRFRFIALDVETACSDVASICQIGLACVQPDNEIQTFSMLNLRFHHHDAGEDARAAAMVVQHAESHLGLSFEDLIKPIGKNGYAPAITMAGNPSGPLIGFTVVFTGALGMSRTEAAELAARAGMSVKAGVTKQTTHLVVGDQDLSLLAGHARSSKHRKAEEMQGAGHPIQIIGESDFRKLVADCGTA